MVDKVCSQNQEYVLLHGLAFCTEALRPYGLEQKEALRQATQIDKRKSMQE
jgi:hypothetical protein